MRGDADFDVMTDHFFPERDLGTYYFRPAEHINTGFVFGRPSAAAVPATPPRAPGC